MGLFGGELTITDGFTSTFNNFTNEITHARDGLNSLNTSTSATLGNSTRSNITMRQQAMTLAQTYRRAGMTQSDALSRAWREIRGQATTANDGIANSSDNSSNRVRNSWIRNLNNIGNRFRNVFSTMRNEMGNTTSQITSMFTKITLGFASISGAKKLFGEGIQAASSYQNAKMFLDAVYGAESEEKYKWAVANSKATPFTESEVANGLARSKSLGMKDDEKSFKMYEDLGSYAKINGTGDLTSAIDAINDAMNGEFTRLQTIIGVKRADLEKFAKENNMPKFTNKKGQVTNKEAFTDVLDAYMGKKGMSGMTEKYANTFQGRLSTMKGNIENALSKFMGIQEDGTIKQNSLFEKLSKGLETFINKTTEFAESQAFINIQDKLESLGGAIMSGFDYIVTHPDLIGNLIKLGIGIKALSMVGGVASSINNIVTIARNVMPAMSALFSGSMASIIASITPLLLPIGLFVGGIMAIGSVLKPDGLLHKGIEKLLGIFDGGLVEKFNNGTKWIVDKLNWLVDSFFGLFGIDTTNTKVFGGDETKSDLSKPIYESQVYNIKDSIDNGSVPYYSTNNTDNGVTNISVNNTFGDVRETADVDAVADAMMTKLSKYQANRNNLR